MTGFLRGGKETEGKGAAVEYPKSISHPPNRLHERPRQESSSQLASRSKRGSGGKIPRPEDRSTATGPPPEGNIKGGGQGYVKCDSGERERLVLPAEDEGRKKGQGLLQVGSGWSIKGGHLTKDSGRPVASGSYRTFRGIRHNSVRAQSLSTRSRGQVLVKIILSIQTIRRGPLECGELKEAPHFHSPRQKPKVRSSIRISGDEKGKSSEEKDRPTA